MFLFYQSFDALYAISDRQAKRDFRLDSEPQVDILACIIPDINQAKGFQSSLLLNQ